MSRRQLTFFLLRANLDVSCGLVLSSLYLLWINVNMCICYQSQIFREGRQNMTSLRLSVKHRLLQRRHLCHVSAATGLTSKTAVFGWKLGPSEVWFYFIYFLAPSDFLSCLQKKTWFQSCNKAGRDLVPKWLRSHRLHPPALDYVGKSSLLISFAVKPQL